MFDVGFSPVVQDDGDHVESAGQILGVLREQVGLRNAGELPLFALVDGDFGVGIVVGGAGFDFDEDQRIAVDGDEVDLTGGAGEIPGDDSITGLFEGSCGTAFTARRKVHAGSPATSTAGTPSRAPSAWDLRAAPSVVAGFLVPVRRFSRRRRAFPTRSRR